MAGTIRKRGEKYLLEFMYQGKRYSKTIEAKNDKEAKEQLVLFTTSIKDGKNPKKNITLYNYSELWLDKYCMPKLREKTIKGYKDYLNNRILPYLGYNTNLKDIKVYTIQEFLNSLTDDLTTTSIKKYKNLLSVMFNTAVKWQMLESNPCLYVDTPKGNDINKIKPTFLDEEEIERLLVCLKDEELKYQCIVRLALQCGMRRSEIIGLTWNDIDFRENTITINKAVSYVSGTGQFVSKTKNESSVRTIYASEDLLQLIQQLPKNSEYLFHNIHIDTITKWFNKFLVKHNLKHLRFHDLRHTHATILISKNIPMKVVSSRLGHSSINTTLNIYTHTLSSDDKKASQII